jgi:transposase-like protein
MTHPPTTQPQRRNYAPEERLRLIGTAMDMHERKCPLNEIATALGVTFGTVAAWIYHPQNQRIRAEALALAVQAKKPQGLSPARRLAKALAAYKHGLPFDDAVRLGGITVETMKKALRALPKPTRHKVYR